MNSKIIIAAIFLVATFQLSSGESRGETGVRGPIESRAAEGYYRRNIPIQSQTQIQYQNSAYPSYQSQSQSFVYLSHIQKPQPEYYSPVVFNNQQPYHQNPHPQVDSSHASHPQQQPAYINPQSSQQQPIFNSYPESTTQRLFSNKYPQPSQQQPASNSYSPPSNSYKPYPPQTNSYQNVQSQQKPNFDSRIDEGSTPEPLTDDFATRKPKPIGTKKPATTRKPPPQILNSRFDDRNSASFKKTLSYDSQLSNSMEKFSLSLLDQFCFKLPTENFMISPFSIYHLLVILAEGANGNTFKEISDKLELVTVSRSRDFQQYLSESLKRNTADVKLSKFAMLVTDRARPVKNEFEIATEQTYDAIVEPVNFLDVDRTVKTINDQVSKATEGQITDTVERDDLFKAQLILISGLFFRGSWMNIFNTTFTKQEPFYDTNGGQTGYVNMMFQRGSLAYAAIAEIGCHAIELPYAEAQNFASRGDIYGSGLSMVVVLPRKGLSLTAAMEKIYSFTMNKIYKELHNSKQEYEDEEVEVHLPRFEMTTSLDIKETLETLGIKEVFDQSKADLSNINNNYFVSSMIHKTKISVDEQGTVAAAVTTSIFANKATPPKFHANKPFLFFIVDKLTNLILFSGQYAEPSLI